MSRPEFDSIADTYDETRGGLVRGDRFAGALAEDFKSGQRVLELGVGTGVVGAGLRDRGVDVFGIDISREMLRRAEGRIPRLIHGDLTVLPFAPRTFDHVYAIWVLHMLPDLTALLGQVRSLIRHDGKFVNCSVGNAASADRVGELVWEMQQALLGDRMSPDAPDRLAALAPSAGFRMVGVRQVSQVFLATPNETADKVARRGHSNLKSVDDGRWRTIVEPTIAALRALPDPDAMVERHVVHDLTVLQAVAH